MTRKQKRLAVILGGLAVLGLAAGLVLYALSGTITFFHTPSDLAETGVKPGQRIRLGGMVEDGSVERGPGTRTTFVVTDQIDTIKVAYDGILPDLFREGQGVDFRQVFSRHPPKTGLGLVAMTAAIGAGAVGAVPREQDADVHLVGLGLQPTEEAANTR